MTLGWLDSWTVPLCANKEAAGIRPGRLRQLNLRTVSTQKGQKSEDPYTGIKS